MKEIFLIENGWIDSMENRDADGYKLTEEEAVKFVDENGFIKKSVKPTHHVVWVGSSLV